MFHKAKKKRVNVKKQNRTFVSILTILLLFSSIQFHAQCAMCRAALQGDENVKQAEAVNDGIVYLMIIPYVLVAILGFAVYKMFKKAKN